MAKQRKDDKGRTWTYSDGEGSWESGIHVIGCGKNNGSKWQIWDGPNRGHYEFATLSAAMANCDDKKDYSGEDDRGEYWAGDKIRLTGKIQKIHGGDFEEFEYLEGHRKGTKGVRMTQEQREKDRPAKKKYEAEQPQPAPEASTLDSYRQHMTGDFLHGKPSPDVQAVIDQGHIPDIPAEW